MNTFLQFIHTIVIILYLKIMFYSYILLSNGVFLIIIVPIAAKISLNSIFNVMLPKYESPIMLANVVDIFNI